VELDNVHKVLAEWPQAISTDQGDLRTLHDEANAGAQAWGERLCWPDFLWAPLDRPSSLAERPPADTIGIRVPAPVRDEPDADLGVFHRVAINRPQPGRYRVADRIECLIELKAILADHVPKLRSYHRGIPWEQFLPKKLRHAFIGRIRHADDQIRDCRRLLGLGQRGVTIIVNEGSPFLTPEVVQAFLASAIAQLPHTDAIVYLSDRPLNASFAVVTKAPGDPIVARFAQEFGMMLQSVDWTSEKPAFRGGPYQQFALRIEMDAPSRAMYCTWSTGCRAADDPTPIPAPRLTGKIVPLADFTPGLS